MFIVSRKTSSIIQNVRNKSIFTPEVILTQENITKTISKFRSIKPIRLQTVEPAKRAAVLIPICNVDGKMSLLFTLRTSQMRSHRGQVSFPGGMQDIKDKNLQATALRETKEELGIPEEDVSILGEGNMIIGRSDTAILPVIGHLKKPIDLQTLKFNHKEVEDVFAISLEDLCDNKKIGHTQFRDAYSTPVFYGGKHKVWGLTGLITYTFLFALFPNSVYKHKIPYIPNASTTRVTK